MTRTTLPFLVIAALAVPALAQTPAATGGGTALDANPQAGSGGVNANAPRVDYQLRNDLVTGNVTGGREFRGQIDYTAPGEFRGQLGSDSIFNFRAYSLPPAPGGPGYTYTSGGAGASVYREYTPFNPQTPMTGAGQAPAYYGGGTRLQVPGMVDGQGYASPLQGVPVTSLGAPQALPPTAGPEYTESSVLGVRPVQPFEGPQAPPTPEAVTSRPADPAEASRDQALFRDTRIEGVTPRTPATGFELIQPTTPDDSPLSPRTEEPIDEAALSRSPTLVLGQRLHGQRTDGRDAQYAERIYESIFTRQSDSAIVPGQSIYNDLVQQVRGGEGQRQGQPADAMRSPYDLPALDEDAVRRAEEQAITAMRRAYGISDDPLRHGRAEEESTDNPIASPTRSENLDPGMRKLVETLNYELPAIRSMAGQEKTRSNEMMRQAEAAIVEGDYFKAESLYKQALMYTPGEPLARAGLVHAQLGAGLFRSASLTLRKLYEQHPELIAARYETRLLPNEERLRWVHAELNKLGSTGGEADPGLLLAYIGYQVNSRQLMRYGLALAQSQNPRDPLLPVLRQIWLDEAPDVADDAQVNLEAAPDTDVTPAAAPATAPETPEK